MCYEVTHRVHNNMQKEQEDYEELFKEAVKQEPMRLPKTEN